MSDYKELKVQKNKVTTVQIDGTVSILYTDNGVVIYHGDNFIEHTPKPLYKHDCDCCIFLGNFDDYQDGYYCPAEKVVIARYGDQGQEYTSSPISEIHHLSSTLNVIPLWYEDHKEQHKIL